MAEKSYKEQMAEQDKWILIRVPCWCGGGWAQFNGPGHARPMAAGAYMMEHWQDGGGKMLHVAELRIVQPVYMEAQTEGKNEH